MDANINNNVSVLEILDSQYSTATVVPYKQNITISSYQQPLTQTVSQTQEDTDCSDNSKNKIWTKNSTLTLLSLYESKIHMLDNPKKKSKMWVSIAEELKTLNVEVTADQVRWKINALTKKYKDCIDNGQDAAAFKYFNEMNQIIGCYNDDSTTYRVASGVSQQDVDKSRKMIPSKSPFRSLRAERKAKAELDNHWIEYLRRQDGERQYREERYERNLRLKEESLKLKRRELEIKQTLALKKIQLRERKQQEILKIEKEKCDLLRKLLGDS